MTTQVEPEFVTNDIVVSLAYTLMVEGSVVDSSDETGPIVFIQGNGDIIPGLESAIDGMRLSESRDVLVAPQDAYGEYDPEARAIVPRAQFPPEIELSTGVQLRVRDTEGHELDTVIADVGDSEITLDFNHPLAGKELNFHVTVTQLRTATEDELAHGHIHSDDHHHEL
ncbi:MAG: peptidylprolyl isomerase [Anaerolineaceae bacterium]|nr:peptidylprolyl isomerase [Anaerolineaceae bacterium]